MLAMSAMGAEVQVAACQTYRIKSSITSSPLAPHRVPSWQLSFSPSGRFSCSATHIADPLPMDIPQILPQLAYLLTWRSNGISPKRSSTPHHLAICFHRSTSSLSDVVLFIYLFPCLLSVSLRGIWAPQDRDFLLFTCVSQEPRLWWGTSMSSVVCTHWEHWLHQWLNPTFPRRPWL